MKRLKPCSIGSGAPSDEACRSRYDRGEAVGFSESYFAPPKSRTLSSEGPDFGGAKYDFTIERSTNQRPPSGEVIRKNQVDGMTFLRAPTNLERFEGRPLRDARRSSASPLIASPPSPRLNQSPSARSTRGQSPISVSRRSRMIEFCYAAQLPCETAVTSSWPQTATARKAGKARDVGRRCSNQ